MCVCKASGSLSNSEQSLVRVHEASCLFKVNDILCVHVRMCVCVCVCVHLPCTSLNCWHSTFKASCFSSTRKYADLHLFFLPALFRWPHLQSRGEKYCSKVQKHTSKSDLNSLFPAVPSGGEKILTQRGRIISAGAGEGEVRFSLLPLRFLPGGRQHVRAA